MTELNAAHALGLLDRDPEGDEKLWRKRHAGLYQHDWVVYAKTPMGGPAQALEYLSRYTHRTAISNERIRRAEQGHVAFAVRADDRGGKRVVRLEGAEFVRRFMLHILTGGIKRIRHYGVLASACKADKLTQARAALAMPTPNAAALESATDFMKRVARIDVLRCPCCGVGQLRQVGMLAAPARLPAPGSTAPTPECRGPP